MQGLSMGMLLCISVHGLACTPPPQPQPAHIGEARARELVLERYNELFGKAYFREQPSGNYVSYPPLEATELTYAEFRGDAWLVQADPPAGMIVKARVAPQGEWVEFTTVSFSAW